MAATIYEPLSTAHLKACTVDFDSRPDKKAVNLVQYDQTIPVLCVSLKKGGTEYKVPSDADVNIRMDKRDGYHVYNPALGVNAERAIAYFAVTPQMSTGWGDYYPIVEITVGGGVAGSAPIWLHFDRNPLPENAIISSDEYKTIQQLLEDVKAVKADTEAIKTATEQIKAQTEAVRDQAKGFADNAKNSADKAQTLVDGMPSDYSQAMKDIGTLKNQMQLAYPDDSTIGENTWSSKNIVDMLCPPLEESGNPVVCYPVAGYPLGVKASWEPVQEGSGDPSPDNVRPIKGRDSVTVERCGENLLNLPIEKVVNGISVTTESDGRYHLKGTLERDGFACQISIIHLPAGTYTVKRSSFSTSLEVNALLIALRKKITPSSTQAWIETTIGSEFINTGSLDKPTDIIVSIFGAEKTLKAGTVIDACLELMLVSGTTNPTTYTPYIGQTNTLTLPETVYGGEVDAVTGEGQDTWKMLTLDGAEPWVRNRDWQIGGRNSYRVNNADIGAKSELNSPAICSHFPTAKYISATNTVDLSGSCICKGKNSFAVILDDANLETVDKWKTYLAEQYSAGSPIQVAFYKETITPITATGAQPLQALAGTNTVLTDADSVTVTGRADPIKRITDLEDAVASQT